MPRVLTGKRAPLSLPGGKAVRAPRFHEVASLLVRRKRPDIASHSEAISHLITSSFNQGFK
jgi:hypothetical protein